MFVISLFSVTAACPENSSCVESSVSVSACRCCVNLRRICVTRGYPDQLVLQLRRLREVGRHQAHLDERPPEHLVEIPESRKPPGFVPAWVLPREAVRACLESEMGVDFFECGGQQFVFYERAGLGQDGLGEELERVACEVLHAHVEEVVEHPADLDLDGFYEGELAAQVFVCGGLVGLVDELEDDLAEAVVLREEGALYLVEQAGDALRADRVCVRSAYSS